MQLGNYHALPAGYAVHRRNTEFHVDQDPHCDEWVQIAFPASALTDPREAFRLARIISRVQSVYRPGRSVARVVHRRGEGEAAEYRFSYLARRDLRERGGARGLYAEEGFKPHRCFLADDASFPFGP
jgi:hypothetical protein